MHTVQFRRFISTFLPQSLSKIQRFSTRSVHNILVELLVVVILGSNLLRAGDIVLTKYINNYDIFLFTEQQQSSYKVI